MTARREVVAKLRQLLTIAEDGSNAETLADYLISMSDDTDREEFLQGLVEAAEGTDAAAAAVAVTGVLSAIRDSKGDTAKRASIDGEAKDDVSGGRTGARRKNRRKGGAGTQASGERVDKAAPSQAAAPPSSSFHSSPASKSGPRAPEQKEQARNRSPFNEASFPMLAASSSSKQKPPQSQNRTSSSPFRYVAPKLSYSNAQDHEHSYPELGFSAAHDTGPKEWVKPTKITRGRDLCLSMWQPWASLVISGHKRVEGRSWYSTHRGRLWIHAGSRNPSKEEIEALEWEYKDRGIPFPKTYPVSCLLGCIEVEDMLSQQEYAEKVRTKLLSMEGSSTTALTTASSPVRRGSRGEQFGFRLRLFSPQPVDQPHIPIRPAQDLY